MRAEVNKATINSVINLHLPPVKSQFLLHKFKHADCVYVKMALPVIKTFTDCTDFSATVAPFIPQLYDLPQQIFQSVANPSALRQLYISTNPLISAFALSLFLAPVFLVVSEVNKNYSEVDRCWSLLPTLYNAHFVIYAHAAGLSTRRLDSLLVCSTIWSVSLGFKSVLHGEVNTFRCA